MEKHPTPAAVIAGQHVSADTAYVVPDYPYGFTLRCQIRYWLDQHPKRGTRLMTQTSNPKKPGLVWNTPKASTYSLIAGALYLYDIGHVQWAALSEYSTLADAERFRDLYAAGVPEMSRERLDRWIAAKRAYEAKRDAAARAATEGA